MTLPAPATPSLVANLFEQEYAKLEKEENNYLQAELAKINQVSQAREAAFKAREEVAEQKHQAGIRKIQERTRKIQATAHPKTSFFNAALQFSFLMVLMVAVIFVSKAVFKR